MDSGAQEYVERMYEVPGFFGPFDAALFARLFEVQDDAGVAGDVLEIGCWFGRSAIFLEFLKGRQGSLQVSDLFDELPPTSAGRTEHAGYSGERPTCSDFKASFRAYHDVLPVIHQGPSSALRVSDLGSGRFRFVHVDGSHTYEAVTYDIALACEIATEGGVLVFDDFANVGHPGVAAALWPTVMQGTLEPFASSPSKLYATLSSDWATRYRGALEELTAQHGYRSSMSELPAGAILSIWPPHERRDLLTRVARRVTRSIGRR